VVWPVYDAKARFSELLEAAVNEGPQVVTRRGVEMAVVLPIDEWNHLKERAAQSVPDPLLDPDSPHDIPMAPRRKLKLRDFSFEQSEES
jgi:prevent-host-death family protein